MINRLCDFFLIIAIVAIYNTFYSFNYSIVFSLAEFFVDEYFCFLNLFLINKITFICLFLFLGAMGKSAQLGVHI
jgi:NADH:ubiquinone oxidoreductase subunit 5 (subunit L)/multisubunit Na+/H+ antiporter MnhA subunit